MMTLRKTYLKLIIVFAVMMLAILGFNTNDVYATGIEEIKDIIPNTINVDISEIEYKKAKTLIENQVKQIIKQSNIENKENLNVKVFYDGGFGTLETFYTATVTVGDAQKEVSIIFNNTKKSINEDEKYVKNLNLENPKYIEMDLDYLAKNKDIWSWFKDFLNEYYLKKINDDTITISTFIGAGTVEGLNLGTCEGGIYLYIFRNNKLYDVKHIGNLSLIPVIIVPSTVLDNELEKYAISEIKKYYPEFGSQIKHVEKGITDNRMVNVDIYKTLDDIYTIKVADGPGAIIFVRKEKTTAVTNIDKTTNIKLETTTEIVPETTTLVAEKVTKGNNYNTVVKALGDDVSKFEMYDISLMNDNKKIQPNGKVKISLPIPNGFDTSKVVVYYVADNGTKTKLDATIKDGYVVFETDHFSNYVVAEQVETIQNQKNVGNNTDNNTTSTNANTSETKRQVDNTPKTGKENTFMISIIAVNLVSAIGLAIVKKL